MNRTIHRKCFLAIFKVLAGEHPYEIIEKIDCLPPYQRELARKGYQGLKVKWQLTFQNLQRATGNQVHVMMSDDEDRVSPLIYAKMDLSKYPILKILKTNQKLSVSAKIREVDGHRIHLEECKFEFDDTVS